MLCEFCEMVRSRKTYNPVRLKIEEKRRIFARKEKEYCQRWAKLLYKVMARERKAVNVSLFYICYVLNTAQGVITNLDP
jgi:hypothetical protein